jgi:hypothetical protein
MSVLVNLFQNPSFETNTTGVAAIPGTTGVAAVTNPASGLYGADCARVTWSTASTAVGGGVALGSATTAGVARTDVVASTQYTAAVQVKASKAKTLVLQALVYNTSGTQVGSTVAATGVAVAAATWTPLSLTFTTPAAGVRLVLQVVDSDATRWSIGNTLDVDGVQVVAGASVPTYGDPSTSLMWAWSGTAHASLSSLYMPSVVLNTHPEGVPPWVEVVITDVSPQVHGVNVTRSAENRTFKVRGGVNVPPAGGVSIVDSECPFVTATYTVELIDSNLATIQFISSGNVLLDVSDTWIHQPLQPALAVKVDYSDTAAQNLTRPATGSLVAPEGATVPTWIGTRRGGLSQVALDVETQTLADADMLQAIFGTYDVEQLVVCCVRTPPPVRLPRVLFASVANGPVEQAQDVQWGGERILWTITGDECQPPAPGLAQTALGYDDLDFYFAAGGYSAMDAAYAAYFDRDRDYSKAGLAP